MSIRVYPVPVTEGAISDRWSLGQLYERLLASLNVTDHAALDLDSKPLSLPAQDASLSPLRIYVFNCTTHPSERRAGDYRIQLRLPGQRRGTRGELVVDGEALTLLIGYSAELDVFVLWDANAHQTFPYSKGVQVGVRTIHEAAITGIAEQRRSVRSRGYNEVVVAARADRLAAGIELRRQRTRESLLAMDLRKTV